MASTPSKAPIRRSTPAQAGPPAGGGAAVAVVADADPQHAQRMPRRSRSTGLGVLGHVGEQLADREIGGRLDRRGPAGRRVERSPGRGRAVEGERPDRVGQPPVGEHRRVHAAHQVTQLRQGLGGRVAASISSDRAAAGSVSISRPAASRVRPSATSRACAPSCRSRSIRRSSAAPVSSDPAGSAPGRRPAARARSAPRREHQPGEAGVGAQQPRGGRHPRRQQQCPACALGRAQVGLPTGCRLTFRATATRRPPRARSGRPARRCRRRRSPPSRAGPSRSPRSFSSHVIRWR